jgi:hypothetical protein
VFTPGTPITTAPPTLVALGGDVKAYYIFSDAGNSSWMQLLTPPPISATNFVFCNHATSHCAAANSGGDIVDLGIRSGTLDFELHNESIGTSFLTGTPDANGDYHAVVTTNFSDFALNPTQMAGAAAGLAAVASLSNVTFIGWEDHTWNQTTHDWDYNDLIFAFTATKPTHQDSPEPLTLALVGAGLMGAFGLRRVKKS